MSLSVSSSMLPEMHCFAEPGNMDFVQRHKLLHRMFCGNNWFTIV